VGTSTRPMPPDARLVADLVLAQVESGKQVEAEEGSGIMVPEIITDKALEVVVRQALAKCNALTAQDVFDLGCTGLAVHGVDIETTQAVRIGLAGSGVGLPCYVGPDRFCLAHNVIGGLQEGQDQRHAHAVAQISRELTPAERSHVAVMETARRTDKGDARDALIGHRVPEEFLKEVTEVMGGPSAPAEPAPAPVAPPAPAAIPAGAMVAVVAAGAPIAPPAIHYQCVACDAVYPWPVPGLPADVQPKERRCTRCFAKPDDAEARFKCPDHTETAWHCRFCVAAELVRGALSPNFLMGHAEVGTTVMMEDMQEFEGAAVPARLAKFEEAGVSGAVLYVKVGRWIRKLARE
jgi:hypothetical protein